MDRYTAAAIGNNLSGALSSIGEMFDPRLRAQADQQRLTNEGLGLRNQGFAIDNQYAPKVYDSNIALTNERAGTERSQQALYGAQTKNWDGRTEGLSNLNKLAASLNVPTTTYSTGAAVGGMDEMQDSWTNKGYTSTGKNLSPGVVAVNPRVHPHGTVFRDDNTGEVFIAADSHGNKDPNVVDIFQEGNTYSPQKVNRNLSVVGREKIPYGTTAEQLATMRQKYADQPQLSPSNINQAAIYSAIANGGGNPSHLVDAFAKVQGMNATDELTARQSLTGQGKTMGQGEYFEPSRSDAFQNRGLENARVIAAGDAQAKLLGDLFAPAGATRRGDGSMLGVPKTAPNSFNDQQKVNEMAQAASFKVFGVPVDEDGAPIEDPYAPTRRAWSQSYSNAMATGMSPIEAEAAANIHHFGTDQPEINSEDTFRFGFGKDPSLPAITNTDPLQASSVFGAQDPAQLATAAAAVPGLFKLPVQTPGISNSGAAVTGVEGSVQPSNPAPAQPAAELAKPLRASDQFKAREGSAERKERESKEKEIASLESDIQNVVKSLQSGEVTLAQAYTPNPQKVKLSDDSYNRTLNRLKEMESRLEKLKGGGVQTGQTATGQQTIRRFNPTTGAIE
jgi:3D (Asp-Asp-Asp) domain-containing protein